MKKLDLHKACSFANTFHFIDNLCEISDNISFEKQFKKINPEELELKKENVSSFKASFLDADLEITDNKISIKFYDKQDSYQFEMIRTSFSNSNIPSKAIYSSTGFEILRLARNTSDNLTFKKLVNKLWYRMSKQDASSDIWGLLG